MKPSNHIGHIIRTLRGDMSLRDFANKCHVSHTTIDNLEKGVDFRTGKPPQAKITTLQKIAAACDVPLSQLLDTTADASAHGSLPILGRVAAGIPTEAIENIEDTVDVPLFMTEGDYMALRVAGDSMEPKISRGDILIIRRQPTADNGDIVIVMVGDDDATCKKFKKTPYGVYLISTNPLYEPMFFSNQEIAELPVRIVGKVVELRARF